MLNDPLYYEQLVKVLATKFQNVNNKFVKMLHNKKVVNAKKHKDLIIHNATFPKLWVDFSITYVVEFCLSTFSIRLTVDKKIRQNTFSITLQLHKLSRSGLEAASCMEISLTSTVAVPVGKRFLFAWRDAITRALLRLVCEAHTVTVTDQPPNGAQTHEHVNSHEAASGPTDAISSSRCNFKFDFMFIYCSIWNISVPAITHDFFFCFYHRLRFILKIFSYRSNELKYPKISVDL